MKDIILVPARAGSKGIKHKNMISLKGKPLIQWTFEICEILKKEFTSFLISDCDLCKKHAENYNINSKFERKANISADETTIKQTLKRFLEWYIEIYGKPNSLTLLQPTSPFRSAQDVLKVHRKAGLKGAAFSCSPALQQPHELIKINKESYDYVAKTLSSNRQEYEKAYFIDGGIYSCRYQFWEEYNNFLVPGKASPVEVEWFRSVDIDEKKDLDLAHAIVRQFKSEI